jgi:hypothetical protein
MTINFSLNEADYLNFQLYIASISPRIKRTRMISKILIPLIYMAFALQSLFNDNNNALFILFGSVALIWFLVYPYIQRAYYKRHYKKSVMDNFSYNFGKKNELELENELIKVKNENSESKISTNEIAEIYETPTIIIIKLKGPSSIIIPNINSVEVLSLKEQLKQLVISLNIKYIEDLGWKWR